MVLDNNLYSSKPILIKFIQGHDARNAYLASVQGKEQSLESLLAQTSRGSAKELPEVAMAKFRETRVAAEKYRQMEEEKRKNDLERTTKQYEELALREQAVFQQIQFSLNNSSSVSI